MAGQDTLITAYFDAWNRHDGEEFAALFDADGTYEDPTTGGLVPPEVLAGVVRWLAGAFPDASLEPDAITGSANRRLIEWTMRGRNGWALGFGIAPTGRRGEPGRH